jgi:hypothetical protein
VKFGLFSRAAALGVSAFVTAAASAENYTAVIYNFPAGYDSFTTRGAGDNVMMSGFTTLSGVARAGYMTHQAFRDMHPSGYTSSAIYDSWGATYHAGYATIPGSEFQHAMFWVGGGAGVDLHPAGAEYLRSVLNCGAGQIQAGYVSGVNIPCAECGHTVEAHAAYWSRTAASFKRIHAPGRDLAMINATDGVKFVGLGRDRIVLKTDAMYWPTATSAPVNLDPGNVLSSSANAIDGNLQGGSVQDVQGWPTGSHAVIWSGTKQSMVDLHPAIPFRDSVVRGMRNGLQVGYAIPKTINRQQALAWHSNAATWINLHSRLPAAFQTWSSAAWDIDNQGNIIGYIRNPSNVYSRPVIWMRLP